MKKVMMSVAVAAMVLGVAACGNQSNKKAAEQPAAETEVVESAEAAVENAAEKVEAAAEAAAEAVTEAVAE